MWHLFVFSLLCVCANAFSDPSQGASEQLSLSDSLSNSFSKIPETYPDVAAHVLLSDAPATTTKEAPRVPPTPKVLTSQLQIWNATESGIPWCDKGMLPALARALDIDIPAVAKANPGVIDFINNLVADNAANKLYSPNTGSSLYSKSPEEAAFARADAIVSNALFGKATDRLGQVMAVATHAMLELAEEQTSADKRRLKEEDAAAPTLMQVLAKPLLLLTSKTTNMFLNQVIGVAVGKERPSGFFGFTYGSPLQGFKSPMINIFDAFCSATQFGMQHEENSQQPICALYNLVTSGLACRDSTLNPDCSKLDDSDQAMWLPETCTPKSGPRNGTTFDPRVEIPEFNFKDVKAEGLFDEATTAALLAEEGLSMFFLYRSTSAAMLYYSVHFPCDQTTPSQQLIPGWDLTHTFSYFSQGSKEESKLARRDTPLVLMLQPAVQSESNKCQIIYTTRGTASQLEWATDLDTVMVPFGIEGVMVHRGFFQMVNSIWPNMRSSIDEFLEKNPHCSEGGEIILTGHSLGGALSSVLALQISKFYSNVKLTVVTFGSPVMFNKQGSELLRERVNSRNVRMDMDPVPRSPCPANLYPGGMVHCDGVLNNGFGFDIAHQNPGVLEIDMMNEMGDVKQFNLTDDIIAFQMWPGIGWGWGALPMSPRGDSSKFAENIDAGALENLDSPGNLEDLEDLGDLDDLSSDESSADSSDFSAAPGRKLFPVKVLVNFEVSAHLPPPLQIGISHSCAYACFFSKYCKRDPAEAWQCADCGMKVPYQYFLKKINVWG